MYPIQITEGFTAHRHETASSGALRPLPRKADFRVSDHGSVCILSPLNERAEDWVDEHIHADRMGWGLKGVVIEARFIGDILRGIASAGYSVEA